MKKLILAGAVALFGMVSAQKSSATGFKVGTHIGLPVGDLAKTSSFNVGVDVAYLHPIADNFKLGATTGYSYYTGKDYTYTYAPGQTITVKGEGSGIIPIAATGQFAVTPEFFIGADLGYAFFTAKGSDGGVFYYQPKVGYDFGAGEVYVGYKGMSRDNASISSINLGAAYKF